MALRKLYNRLFVLIIFFSLTHSPAHAELQEGELAPEIVLKDINGNVVTLSSLRGKIVLIDFWASWCHPCRNANPVLAETYLKYHHKGFEILSISLDEEKHKWEAAINEDRLPWNLNVSDQKGWKSSVVNTYNVTGLPTSFLINRKGEIIVTDPMVEDIEIELEEIFLEEIFFYPKNAATKLYLSMPTHYVVKSSKGKKVLKGKGEEIDLTELEAGLYTLHFEGKIESFLKKTPPSVKINALRIENNTRLILENAGAYQVLTVNGDVSLEGNSAIIDISSLPSGQYLITVDGFTKKFIKK